jgi:hypothetical protein
MAEVSRGEACLATAAYTSAVDGDRDAAAEFLLRQMGLSIKRNGLILIPPRWSPRPRSALSDHQGKPEQCYQALLALSGLVSRRKDQPG